MGWIISSTHKKSVGTKNIRQEEPSLVETTTENKPISSENNEEQVEDSLRDE